MTSPDPHVSFALSHKPQRFDVYDTTMRDGAQQEGITLSVGDKFEIARHIDDLGVSFIEGGWPGAIPKDTEFFARAATELNLKNAVLAAFGATRKPDQRVEQDPQVRALLDSQTPVVTLVAKSHARHVELALRTTLEENLAMISDTVSFLVAEGRRVFLDAEHFFDGYQLNPKYALAALDAGFSAGAEVVALCDTNGGMLPSWVSAVVREVREHSPGLLGIHAHNDTGCAVANSIAAVESGACHVQGTVNGYGERTGNADLMTVIANLQLKYGLPLIHEESMRDLTRTAHAISELTNIRPQGRQPYVGASAFAHKAGLHASAIAQDPDLYQHIDPAQVGNGMRMLVSDMAGRASIALKAKELGIDLSERPEVLTAVVTRVKEAEAVGYTYDAADASFELLLAEEIDGSPVEYFDVEAWSAITQMHAGQLATSQATIELRDSAGVIATLTGEGNGPVNALDHALRLGLTSIYPELEHFQLTDFTVRILDTSQGTDAVTRVLITTTGLESTWRTVGVGPNILDASWDALVDSIAYGLRKAHVIRR